MNQGPKIHQENMIARPLTCLAERQSEAIYVDPANDFALFPDWSNQIECLVNKCRPRYVFKRCQ